MEKELKLNQDREAGRERGMVKRWGVAMQDLTPRIPRILQAQAPLNKRRLAAGRLLAVFGIGLLAAACSQSREITTVGAERQVYRTHITGEPGYFSVSPTGDYLVFNTRQFRQPLQLLELASGKITTVPGEAGRLWEMPRWSPDGKRLVAVSTGVFVGYDLSDMKIVLIEPSTWTWKVISPSGGGVKIEPFFSRDGKMIYYFKGQPRSGGATLAAKYDLYAISLSDLREERLSHEEFYQVSAGDASADGRNIYFSKIGGRASLLNSGEKSNADTSVIVSLDVQTKELQAIGHFETPQFIGFYKPRIDSNDRMYFQGSTRQRGKPYLYSLWLAGRGAQSAMKLADFLDGFGRFDLAKSNGGIYVSTSIDGDIAFLRINTEQASNP